MTRNENMLKLRPEIVLDNTKTSLSEESFQNFTLRPILKFQNDVILALVKKHLAKFIIDKSKEESTKLIESRLAEQVIKQQLIGLTIGLFTLEEFDYYLQNKSSINKRINQLIVQRVCSQLLK
jgi:hypothetical protein